MYMYFMYDNCYAKLQYNTIPPEITGTVVQTVQKYGGERRALYTCNKGSHAGHCVSVGRNDKWSLTQTRTRSKRSTHRERRVEYEYCIRSESQGAATAGRS